MVHGYLLRRWRQAWHRFASFLTHRVLHVDDTPHRIALGVAVGMFVAWLPLPGLQMAVTFLLCAAVRANKVVGLPCAWVSNPLTVFPVYYPSYRLGLLLLPGLAEEAGHWQRMMRELLGGGLSPWQRLERLGSFSWDVMAPLWLGCAIAGLLVGALSYWITYFWVTRHRQRAARRRALAGSEQAGAAVESKGSLVG